MKEKQGEIYFHLSQMVMLKNYVFANTELKIPYQQVLVSLSFMNRFFEN